MNSLVNERETMKYYWNEFNEAGTKISTPSVFYSYLCIHIHTTLLRFFFPVLEKREMYRLSILLRIVVSSRSRKNGRRKVDFNTTFRSNISSRSNR